MKASKSCAVYGTHQFFNIDKDRYQCCFACGYQPWYDTEWVHEIALIQDKKRFPSER